MSKTSDASKEQKFDFSSSAVPEIPKKNIKIVKLLTSEELIAEVRETQGADGYPYCTLYKAASVGVVRNQQGNPSVMIVPFMPFADQSNGITMPSSTVLFVVDPAPEMLAQYNQLVGNSKIITPGKPGLIT